MSGTGWVRRCAGELTPAPVPLILEQGGVRRAPLHDQMGRGLLDAEEMCRVEMPR